MPLDPEWNGDQAILAVLVLLPALGYLIPWDGEIGEFAEGSSRGRVRVHPGWPVSQHTRRQAG